MKFHEILDRWPPQEEITSWDHFSREFKQRLEAKKEELESSAQRTNCRLNHQGAFSVTLESGLQVRPVQKGPDLQLAPDGAWVAAEKRKWNSDDKSAFNNLKEAYFQWVQLEEAVAGLPVAQAEFQLECQKHLGGVLGSENAGGAETLASAIEFYEEQKSRLPADVRRKFLEAEQRIRLADFEQAPPADEEKFRDAFREFRERLDPGGAIYEESQKKLQSAENRKEFQRRLEAIRNATDAAAIDQLKKVVEDLVRGNANDLPKDALEEVQRVYERACQNFPPAMPGKLRATTNKEQLVSVSWDGARGAAEYLVYRSESAAVETREYVETVKAPETSYPDETAKPETDYYYWVTASNAKGESASPASAKGRCEKSSGLSMDIMNWLIEASETGDVPTVFPIYCKNLAHAEDIMGFLQETVAKRLLISGQILKLAPTGAEGGELKTKHLDVESKLNLLLRLEKDPGRKADIKELIKNNKEFLKDIDRTPPPSESGRKYASAIESGNTAMAAGKFVEAIQYFNEALAIKPGDPQAIELKDRAERGLKFQSAMAEGRKALLAKDYGGAIHQFGVALTVRPDDADAKGLKQTAEVEQSYAAAIAAAEAAVRAGNFEEAIERVNLALQAKPGGPQALELKDRAERELKFQSAMAAGEAAILAEKFAEAIGCFDEALRIKPKDTEAQKRKGFAQAGQKFSEAMAAGQSALESKQFDEAIKQANLASAIKPGNEAAASLRHEAENLRQHFESEQKYAAAMVSGEAAVLAGKFAEAIGRFDEALRIKPADAEAQRRKGFAQTEQKFIEAMVAGQSALESKQFDEAIKQADLALGIKPGNKAAASLLHEAENLRQHFESEQKYAAAMVLGEAAILAGKFAEAVRHFDAALLIKPNDPAALERKQAAHDGEGVELNLQLGNEQKLVCQQAKEAGEKALSAGEFSKAVQHFIEALRADPKDTEAQTRKDFAEHEQKYHLAMQAGQAALEARDFAEAIRQAERALSVKGNDPDAGKLKQEAESGQKYAAALAAGEAALAVGKFGEAIGHFDEALRIKPSGAEAQKRKAFAQTEQKCSEAMATGQRAVDAKQFDEAIKQTDFLLEFKPGDTAAKNLRQRAENEQKYDSALTACRKVTAERKWDEAIQAADSALLIKPGDAEARKLKQQAASEIEFDSAMAAGRASLTGKKFTEAIEFFAKARAIKPDDKEARKLEQGAERDLAYESAMESGHAAFKAGDFIQAIKQAEQALKARPGDKDAQELKKEAEAKQIYIMTVEAAEAAARKNNHKEVIKQADLVLAAKPNDPRASELKRKALEELKIPVTPGDLAVPIEVILEKQYKTSLAEGRKTLEKEDFTKAIAHFELALTAKPGDADAQKLLKEAVSGKDYKAAMAMAMAMVQVRNYKDAIEQAVLALKARPGDAAAEKLKQSAEVEFQYESAMEAARQAMAAHRYDTAIKQSEVALAARPGDSEALKLKQEAEPKKAAQVKLGCTTLLVAAGGVMILVALLVWHHLRAVNDEKQAIDQAASLAEKGEVQDLEQLAVKYPDQQTIWDKDLARAREVEAARIIPKLPPKTLPVVVPYVQPKPVPPVQPNPVANTQPDADAIAKAKADAMAVALALAKRGDVQGIKDLEQQHPTLTKDLSSYEKDATDLADKLVKEAVAAVDVANVSYIEGLMDTYAPLKQQLQPAYDLAKMKKDEALTRARRDAAQGNLDDLNDVETHYPALAEYFNPIEAAAKISDEATTWEHQGNVATLNKYMVMFPSLQAGLQSYLDEAKKVQQAELARADGFAEAADVKDLNDLIISDPYIPELAERVKVAETTRESVINRARTDAKNGLEADVEQLQKQYRAVDLSEEIAQAHKKLIQASASQFLATGPQLPDNLADGIKYRNGLRMEFVYVTQNGDWPGGLIGLSEVTRDQYLQVEGFQPVGANGGGAAPIVGSQPLTASKFCKDLTDQERANGNIPDGSTYRLPTSREWEALIRQKSDLFQKTSSNLQQITYDGRDPDRPYNLYHGENPIPSPGNSTSRNGCFKVVLVQAPQ